MLVSRALLERVTTVRTRVEPPPAAADSVVQTEVPSIGDNPRARRDAPGSDHAPVLAALDLD